MQNKLQIADDSKAKPTRRFSFTRARLNAERLPTSGRVYVWDGDTKGLACCITAAGSRTYYHVRKLRNPDASGKRAVVRTRIDSVDAITVEDARAKSRKLNNTVADGANPVEVRKEQARKENAEKIFDQVFDDYIDDRRFNGRRTVDEMARKGEIYLGELQGRKLNSIATDEIEKLHAGIARGIEFEGRKYGGKGAANRVIELLSAVFNFGKRKENPCDEVARFGETKRQRYLVADELPRFFDALDQESPVLRDFFKLALWTGQRRANVQAMRWDEIGEAEGTWTIPAAKFKNVCDKSRLSR